MMYKCVVYSISTFVFELSLMTFNLKALDMLKLFTNNHGNSIINFEIYNFVILEQI
jgi:hypothetical protein